MKFCMIGHDLRHATEEMLLHLLPEQTPEYTKTKPEMGDYAITWISTSANAITARAEVRIGDKSRVAERTEVPQDSSDLEIKRVMNRVLKLSLYDAVVPFLDEKPVWGALTGMRPAKLARLMIEKGQSMQQVRRTLETEYDVAPQRTDLTLAAAKTAIAIDKKLRNNGVSIYVGIPFCPSRCAYCSFVSAAIAGAGALIPPYLDVLCREIRDTGALLQQAGAVIDSLYIGGGTPTTLTVAQLDRLLTVLETEFNLSTCLEYTVEAGRPDTITLDKLRVLKSHGVDRISINPQSMNDTVLEKAGRRHSAADVLRAYDQAQGVGFRAINMDTIAGLAGDSPDSFAHTIDTLLALRPENITVHTLAIKKGADLIDISQNVAQRDAVSRMLTYAGAALTERDFRPYYLYRQKFSAGGMENVGWCREGFAGVYNVAMMEELQTILSLGAGGVSKWVERRSGKIRRFNNPKYPQEYMRAGERLSLGKQSLMNLK